MELKTIGELLKKFRREAGLTQEVLAERSKLSIRSISDLERGLSRQPRYETLDLLTKALGLSAEQRVALFSLARPSLPGADTPKPPLPVLPVLPVPPTLMLGRDQELTLGLELLGKGQTRLLTVTGPGGVGKTRLALQLADELNPAFESNLAWVDLSAVSNPALVPQAITERLHLNEQVGRSHSGQLIAFLEDKSFLKICHLERRRCRIKRSIVGILTGTGVTIGDA